MRIPPLHRRKGYQRFFAGIVIGLIIGWFFFLLSFGGLQDFYMTEIDRRDEVIKDLKDEFKYFKQDYEEKNKENEKKLTIQEIKIIFTNREQVGIKGITFLSLENAVKTQLHDVLTKDIESVGKNDDLLYRAIENKIYHIEKEKFTVTVTKLHLYTTLRLYLNIERVK